MNIFISDIHSPYHNVVFFKSFLRFIKQYKPKSIILGGDIIDFHQISKFLKTKREKTEELQFEIDITNELLKNLRKTHSGTIHYIEGNHEERIIKFLGSDGEKLASLRCLELKNLLGLSELDIKYHINKIKIDGWLLVHGHRERAISKHSAYSVKKLIEKYRHNVIMGHTHRQGNHNVTILNKTYIGVECGTIQDPRKVNYIEEPNWQFGFIVFGKNWFDIAWFINNKILFRGKEI